MEKQALSMLEMVVNPSSRIMSTSSVLRRNEASGHIAIALHATPPCYRRRADHRLDLTIQAQELDNDHRPQDPLNTAKFCSSPTTSWWWRRIANSLSIL
jgi:hypothetical protein